MEFGGEERGCFRLVGNVLFFTVAADLFPAYFTRAVLALYRKFVDVFFVHGANSAVHLNFFVPYMVRFKPDWGFHRDECEKLHHMVLNDVPYNPCLIVEPRPVLYADLLCHCDLHMVYVASVPERFEYAVGKTEEEYVLDSLFSEVMVDTVDLVLIERF